MEVRMKEPKTAKQNPLDKKNTSSPKLSIAGTKKPSNKICTPKRTEIKKINAFEQENLLQKSNILFKLNPSSIVLMTLPDRKLIDINETALKTFGFSREEVIGKTSDELNIFMQQDRRRNALEQLLTNGYIENYEMKFRSNDGKTIIGLFSAESIKHQDKGYLLAILTDITNQKLAQKAQRKNEEKYRTILETTEEGYYEIDLAGNFTFFNEPVCKLLGYSREELMGMNNRNYTDRKTAKKSFSGL